MSKKKDKPKKISAKKEKYAKFHKEKPDAMDFSTPELTPEQIKQQREDQTRFEKFLKFKGRSAKELNEKKKRMNIR